MQLVRDFFREIDQRWPNDPSGKVRIHVIGCGALLLQTRYQRGTKDSDVFDTLGLAAATKAHLLQLAGPGTELARRRRMYIDIVANGIPFLPHPPQWHAIDDIDEMVMSSRVPQDRLVARFRSAADEWAHCAFADQLPQYVRNLNEVERDMIGGAETEIELPPWV